MVFFVILYILFYALYNYDVYSYINYHLKVSHSLQKNLKNSGKLTNANPTDVAEVIILVCFLGIFLLCNLHMNRLIIYIKCKHMTF